MNEFSQEIQVQLLETIIDPRIACSGKFLRARACPTKIKILYHLFQLEKNVASGKWSSIYQGKTAISKCAGVGKKHFAEFINSPDFELFGEVDHRKGTTNIYRLKKWVIETFTFFERTGLMKNFRQNFEEWREKFCRRLHKWLLPLLRAGHSLYQIFVNKLSTKKPLKGDDPKVLKGDGIKPSGSYEAFQGSKSKHELPVVNQFVDILGKLKDRFLLKEGDINQIMGRYSLSHLKKAIRKGEEWLKNGLDVRSPVQTFQSCLNKTRSYFGGK